MAAQRTGNDGRFALLAIGGFLAIAVWLVLRESSTQAPYEPPYSTFSSNAAGIRALYELLEDRGNDVSRHTLTEHEYPKGSCVVIAEESALNPFKMVVNPLDVMALELHLQDGGSLVVFSDSDLAMVDELDNLLAGEDGNGEVGDAESPAVARRGKAGLPGGNGNWRGGMAGQGYELADSRPPLLQDVGRIETAYGWSQALLAFRPVLSLEETFGKRGFAPLVSYARYGNGDIILVNRPEIITNSWIERADNHRLALALIEGIAAGAPIVFDEHIHGYNTERMTAGSLLTSSTGGRLTLLAVACIVVMYLGLAVLPARIQSQKAPPRRQATEMVLGQASLFQRAGFIRGSLRHIVDGLKHELVRSHDFQVLPSDRELLDWSRSNMPKGWKIDGTLEEFLLGGTFPPSKLALMRASLSCDAMRMQAWQRPL